MAVVCLLIYVLGILGYLGRICADGGFYVLGSMCVGVGGVVVVSSNIFFKMEPEMLCVYLQAY